MNPFILANLLWVSPIWAWAALGAAAMPVAIHLLSRRRYRVVDFPAARFVAMAVSQAAAIDQPRHRLLMLLRILALLAIVAAFMRPIWQPSASAALPSGGGKTLVLLIDGSASMQRISAGQSAFEQALGRAEEQLADLTAGRDRAMVYVVTDRAEPVLPEPSGQLSLLRARVAELQPTWKADDAEAALAAIDRTVEQWAAAEVYWITDGQSVEDAATLPWPTDVRVLSVGQPMNNTSVHWVQMRPYPAVAGQPMTATVRVRRFADTQADVQVVARMGDTQTSRTIRLDAVADQLTSLNFEDVPAESTWLNVSLEDPSSFTADDRTGYFIVPASSREVLVVAGETRSFLAPRLAEMLSPTAKPAEREAGVVRVSQMRPSELSSQVPSLSATSVIVLAGLDVTLDATAAESLATFLARGGGVVLFGDTPSSRAAIGALPAPIAYTDSRAELSSAASGFGDLNQDELAVFEGPSRQLLADIAWPGVESATLTEAGRGIWMSPQGWPIVASRSVGRGRLYVINADLAAADSSLTLHPGFIVMINELVRLAPAGELASDPPRPGDLLSSQQGAGQDQWPAERATEPGPIEIRRGGRVVAGQWVEVDARESDLMQQFDDDLIAAQSESETDGSQAASLGPANRVKTIELWPYLLLGAMLLLSVEGFAVLLHQRGGGR